MKILLAVDGSEIGLAAVRHLVELSKSLADLPTVTLLYVDPPLLRSVALELGSDGVERYHAENGAYAMKKARTALKRAQLPFAEKIVVGEPAESIVKQAKATKADLKKLRDELAALEKEANPLVQRRASGFGRAVGY